MRHLNIIESVTSISDDCLSRYLKEIKKVKFLTPDEENELIIRIRKKDLRALEKLVTANLRFVVSVAKHYQHQGLSLSDLISEGNLGLLKAAERYDETRGFKFISYAVWWIRQSIIQALDEHSRIVRLPRNKVSSLSKITAAFKKLEQEIGREPTCEELACTLDLELQDVQKALGLEMRQISIDAPISAEEGKTLTDVLENQNAESPDHEILHNESLQKEIQYLLICLNEKQARVVKMYFGIGNEQPMNYYEISRRLNVSSERIRQIKEAALARMQNSMQVKTTEEPVKIKRRQVA